MFEDLPIAAHTELVDALGRLKHDLGKYVCFRQRWLGEDVPHEALEEAVRSDLLQTRSGPSGTQAVDEVWATFEPWLAGRQPVGGTMLDLRVHPVGAALFGAMADLLSVLPTLRARSLSPDMLTRVSATCREVSEHVRTLHAEARRSLGDR